MKKPVVLAMGAVASLCLAVTADTLTWVGGATGNFSDAGAWQDASGAAKTPSAGDSLVIPMSNEVLVASADSAVFRSAETMVNIAEDAKLNVKGVTGNFELYAVLSGPGVMAVTDSLDKWVRFRSDNSAFTGVFAFTNSTVCVDHAKALGIACPVYAEGPASGSAWFLLNSSATLENPMTIRSKNYFTFANYGWLVTFAGPVTFKGFTRFQSGNNAANTRYIFSGPVTVNGQLDPYLEAFATKNNYLRFAQTETLNMNGNVFNTDKDVAQRVIFDCPVTGFTSSGESFLQVVNGIEYVFNSDILGSDAAGFSVKFSKGTIDVAGHTIKVGNTWQGKGQFNLDTAGSPKLITSSASNGVVWVSGMVTGAATYDGRLGGHVSFDYNSNFDGNTADGKTACWCIKLKNRDEEVSDTDGDLIATKGWIELLDKTTFTKLGNLVSKNAGRITVNTGVTVGPKTNAKIYGNGKFELKSGVDLKVAYMWTYPDNASEVGTPVPPGKYSSVADPSKGIEALPCLVGDGVLTVTKPSGLTVILK